MALKISQNLGQSFLKQNKHSFKKGESIQLILQRGFAEGEEVRKPKVYKNVFNKWTSRDGKRVYFTTYPHDYNEPWPFPPVYGPDGHDLNKDDVWGDGGEAPPSSITGKPKRALGHYPWLGRAIVPYDDQHRWIFDDQVAPMPLFSVGRYEANRTFWWQWIFSGMVFFGAWYILDRVIRGDGKWGNLANKRDELWYVEHMAPPQAIHRPLGWAYYANPCGPMKLQREGKDRWCFYNNFISMRHTHVFIPAAKEDNPDFADDNPNYFKLKGYNC